MTPLLTKLRKITGWILIIVSFGGSFLGAYIGFLGIFQTIIIISLLVLLFTPLDHWIHLHFLKKSKLREQKQNE